MTEPRVIYAEDSQNILPSIQSPRPIFVEDFEEVETKKIYAEDYKPKNLIPVGEDNSSYVNLDEIFEEYGGPQSLTKEDILADDRLMEVVISSLEARYTPGGALTKARRTATGLAGGDVGGLSGRDYRSMDKEKVFEIWQNYQRSFAGGQTVTTANELAYGLNSDDDTKMKVGAGYYLFGEGMTNAFTGEGSWSEMGDATFDYVKAALFDPTTILSLGLGKVLGFGATKAGGAVARSLMINAYKDGIKKGLTKTSAIKAIGESVKKAVPFAIADASLTAGVDVGYQMQLINVGVQEEYSKMQTGLTALGGMVVIPTLTALGATAREFRKSDLAPQFLSYKEFDENSLKLGVEEAERLLKERVQKDIIVDAVDENFGTIKGSTKNFLIWAELKDVADGRIRESGEEFTDSEVMNAFFTYFFKGNPEDGTKGYGQVLKEAGFVVHDAMIEKYGNKTAVYANSINFLSTKQVRKIVKKFEKDSKYKLKFISKDGKTVGSDKVTPASLESQLVKQTKEAGVSLQIISNLDRMKPNKNDKHTRLDALELLTSIKKEQETGITIGSRVSPTDRGNIGTIQAIKGNTADVLFVNKKDGTEAVKNFKLKDLKYIYPKGAVEKAKNVLGIGLKEEDPRRGQFIMSTYKRLLTSHLSTTGANIKGFTALVSLNSAADLATSAINFGQSKFYKYVNGDVDKAEVYINRAYGSLAGVGRRFADAISPDLPMSYADKVLELNPDFNTRLFRDVSGDGGVRESMEVFNLDKTVAPERMLWKTADSVTKGAQTLTLVRLQDDLTKRWAFGTNTNQAIMREYGVSPEVFYSRPDVALEMASDRFKEMVLEKALFRTQRETASVNWSTLPGREGLYAARTWAKGIEIATNRSPLGFVVPFGSFLNTTVATMADLTGVNAFRFGIRKLTGDELDFATREGAEAVGKWAAGWATIYLGIYSADIISELGGTGGGAKDRIKNNLSYNQDIKEDGSITDTRYDWPISTMRLLSQIAAHAMGDSDDVRKIITNRSEIPPDLLRELAVQIGAQSVRDLDRVGQSIVYASNEILEGNFKPFIDMLGGTGNRIVQGVTRPLDPINQIVGLVSDKNMNPNLKEGAGIQGQMMRYMNNIFGDTDDLPQKATATRGEQFTPDVGKQILGVRGLSSPNIVEQMMNAAGKPYWEALGRIDAPENIRNKMKNIAAPFFESSAIKYLRNNPDYFKLPLEKKQEILRRMKEETRINMMDVLEKGMPRSINILRVLDTKDKDKVNRIMDFLGIDGELEDLLKEENSLPTLLKIQSLLKSYDDIFFGDLK